MAGTEKKNWNAPAVSKYMPPEAINLSDGRGTMEIDGLDWMDWLHKVRHDAEAKRIRDGLSVEDWLHQVRVRAVESRARRRSREDSAVVRDKPPSGE